MKLDVKSQKFHRGNMTILATGCQQVFSLTAIITIGKT